LGEPSSEKIIDIDARMLFGDLNIKTFVHLSKISPFGSSNHNPLFISKNLTLVEAKSLTQGKHAKLKLSNGEKTWIAANAWRKGYICDEFKPGDRVDVVYTLELDNWSGNNNLVMIIEDIKAT
jgi:single-stranded-DNA-specific exonuclease